MQLDYFVRMLRKSSSKCKNNMKIRKTLIYCKNDSGKPFQVQNIKYRNVFNDLIKSCFPSLSVVGTIISYLNGRHLG